jgi:hypothetical protein
VEAIALAVRLLEAEGLVVTARNDRGDSVYLALPGETASLRVSNHARTPKQRLKHPEVLTSLVLHGRNGPAQVEALAARSLRVFRVERERRSKV